MLKFIKRFFLVIFILVFLFSAYAVISGKTYLFKAVWYNFAGIDDYKIFNNNTVNISDAQPWPVSKNFNKTDPPEDVSQLLIRINTVALVVIKSDSLFYEKYWDGYSDSSWSSSFSMAKSITSLLVGAAIKEGKIKSVDQLVSDYLPEFREGLAAKMKIKDLLTMSSGSNWDEAYANPFSMTTEAYYGNNLYKTATKVKIKKQPGTYHEYKSGDTELLGLIVETATGKSLSQYASEKLWQPMGAEHPALWSTDKKNGNEKAYCCFNSNARDFARIGQLMLDSGRWKGKAVIEMDYYKQSVTPCNIPDESGDPCTYYGYQWWIDPNDPDVFYAWGILGQYTIVIPAKKVVIVRLGRKSSDWQINGLGEEVDTLIRWGVKL